MNKVMIIEDDQGARVLCEKEIPDGGCSFISSDNGKGIFEILEAQHPDLILFHVKLRGTDGLGLLHKISKTIGASR